MVAGASRATTFYVKACQTPGNIQCHFTITPWKTYPVVPMLHANHDSRMISLKAFEPVEYRKGFVYVRWDSDCFIDFYSDEGSISSATKGDFQRKCKHLVVGRGTPRMMKQYIHDLIGNFESLVKVKCIYWGHRPQEDDIHLFTFPLTTGSFCEKYPQLDCRPGNSDESIEIVRRSDIYRYNKMRWSVSQGETFKWILKGLV